MVIRLVRAFTGMPRWAPVGMGTVVVLVAAYLSFGSMSTVDVRVDGLPAHPITPAAAGSGSVLVAASVPADRLRVLVDGREATTDPRGGALSVRAAGLADGVHELRIVAPRPFPWFGTTTTTRQFTVDGTPPGLQVEDSLHPEAAGQPVTVTGIARGAARVTVAGHTATPGPDGAFSVVVDRPEHEVSVVATDAAGNRVERTLTVHTRHPGMRAVHMTGLAWTSEALREPVLDMARQGKIDAVELDIKDESGEVPYDSAVPMAQQIGAVRGYYHARQVLDQLHGMHLRVVGRLVAFKDPILGGASWRDGHPERVVQTAEGTPWSGGGYGQYAFTNFADPVVRQYNVDIAAEAAALGFDDILYDYVRRPDGPIERMRFPGLTTTPEAGIADFLRQTQVAVRSHHAMLGASVFGISVNRPTQIAQDIPQMSRYVDYVAPMVYPSHWGPGEFNVPDPNRQPYDIVRRSLAEFARAVQGTDVQIIPWLQDFSLGVPYGPAEVAAQIGAARDDGMPSFLLWAPNCRYHDQPLAR
ncbi:putative glycoside hydrolase [Gandjariella thermophila]|uniref:putative glycoside hydrolase n=1 Tax=Gandjariella thermophila TaxID=1931992 RepID=UPI001CEF73A8|nr:putative glycoside hydrolase [Gandjariella thermophila]